MKSPLLLLGLVSSMAFGQSIHDYQGHLMTGPGGTETLDAQIEYFGPINNPLTPVNVSVSVFGTFSGSYALDGCPINTCEDPIDPLVVHINESHGKFKSADLTFSGILGPQGSFDVDSLVIGPKGDSVEVFDLSSFMPLLLVSNSTPGGWKKVPVGKAPELNPNDALAAMTLLACGFLISMGRRRRE